MGKKVRAQNRARRIKIARREIPGKNLCARFRSGCQLPKKPTAISRKRQIRTRHQSRISAPGFSFARDLFRGPRCRRERNATPRLENRRVTSASLSSVVCFFQRQTKGLRDVRDVRDEPPLPLPPSLQHRHDILRRGVDVHARQQDHDGEEDEQQRHLLSLGGNLRDVILRRKLGRALAD